MFGFGFWTSEGLYSLSRLLYSIGDIHYLGIMHMYKAPWCEDRLAVVLLALVGPARSFGRAKV